MSFRSRLPQVARPLFLLAFTPVFAFACDTGQTSDQEAGGGSVSALGGSTGSGGATSSGGSNDTASGGAAFPSMFGTPVQAPSGSTSAQYAKSAVTRNGDNYFFMANGWGPGFQSQSIDYNGTSFTITSMQGKQGAKYEPASYPTVFCGAYSDSMSGQCGLPAALTALTSLRTGWRWQPNGNTGQYNAAYDIWLSSSNAVSGLAAYLMVWLRDPPGQQPAGSIKASKISVPGVPGVWNLWVGTVSSKPYIAYARPEGSDSYEIEFDVMSFVHDVPTHSISLPGTQILSVAVGFEIWNGPITNLESQDFYVDVK